MFTVTKTYGNERGLSATFRQWRADSHCRFLHGYALGFEVVIGCQDYMLDMRNWAFDFGGFKDFKAWLDDMFDHKTVVAEDDPLIEYFQGAAEPTLYPDNSPLMQLRVLPAVGCEAFAKLAWDKMTELVREQNEHHRVFVMSVRCFEHGSNSATYHGYDQSFRWLGE